MDTAPPAHGSAQEPSAADAGIRPAHFTWLVCAGLALVFVATFWPMALGRHFLYGDLGNMHLPLRLFYAEALASGDAPWWIPNLFTGFYLHAEGQVGMLHPLHALAYRFLPFDLAFAIDSAVAYPLAIVGSLLFLRALKLPTSSAWLGAVVFGFAPYLTLRFMHINVVAVLAHVPWLLFATHRLLRASEPGARRGAWIAIALLVASQLLLGYPGAFVASAACVALYALALRLQFPGGAPLLPLATAAFVGLAIGAAQWLPTLGLFLDSNRADTPAAMLSAQSLHPRNLLQLVAPYLYTERVYQVDAPNPIEQGFYFGSLVPLAWAWVAMRWRALPLSTGARRLALGVAVGALVLCLGRYGGLSGLLGYVPLIGELRNPSRWSFLLVLVGMLAVAWALHDARRVDPATRRRTLRRLWLVPAAAFGVAVIALASPAAGSTATAFAPAPWLAAGPALALLALALWQRAARGGALALGLLVVFAAAEQAAFGATLWWSEPPQRISRFVDETPANPLGEPGRLAVGYTDYVRKDDDGTIHFFASTRRLLRGARLVSGWTGLMPTRVLPPYVDEAGEEGTSSVRRRYAPRAVRLAAATHLRRGKHLVGLPEPLPPFRMVTDARVSDDVARDVEELPLRTAALVERSLELEAGEPGDVRVAEERAGALRLLAQAPTRQLLVITESFHPGWRATVDGEPADILRTNGDYMGIVVDAGARDVRLRFAPRDLRIGAGISAMGLLALLCSGIAVRRGTQSEASTAE